MRASMGATWGAVQPPHTQCSMCIDSYQFLPVISSVMITCTYPFTVDALMVIQIIPQIRPESNKFKCLMGIYKKTKFLCCVLRPCRVCFIQQ